MKHATRAIIAMLFVAYSLWLSPACAAHSLYRPLGRSQGIANIVDNAATHWLADQRISAVFDNADRMRISQRIADHVCLLAGRPFHDKMPDLRCVHQGLDIRRAQFNAVAEALQDTMETAEVDYTTQDRFLALLAPKQRDVVGQ